MIVEKHIVIEGNHQLNGDIKIKGAKNAVLKQMVLPLLASGESIIKVLFSNEDLIPK